MSETIKGNTGATKERLRKSRMAPIITELTPGGLVKSASHQDTEHCTLDRLLRAGQLGDGTEAMLRYDTGYSFRNLYFTFNVRTSIAERGGGGLYDFTTETDSPAEQAEERFGAVLKALPNQYRRIVRFVCIEDVAGEFDDQTAMLIRDGLDALWAALGRV